MKRPKRKRLVSSKAFIDALVAQTPKFDEEIMKDIRGADSWIEGLPCDIGRITLGMRLAFFIYTISRWVRRIARKIERRYKMKSYPWCLSFARESEPVGTPVEITQDRFRNVWPNIAKDSKPTNRKRKRKR
jgi:hypothetical protein